MFLDFCLRTAERARKFPIVVRPPNRFFSLELVSTLPVHPLEDPTLVLVEQELKTIVELRRHSYCCRTCTLGSPCPLESSASVRSSLGHWRALAVVLPARGLPDRPAPSCPARGRCRGELSAWNDRRCETDRSC
jgi:hypothetical protein